MTVRELYDAIGGNYDEALNRMMNEGIITRFVLRFLENDTYDKLKEAVANKDDKAIFETSHALKGVTATLAFTPMAQISGVITDSTRPGRDDLRAALDLEQKMSELDEAYNITIAALTKFKSEL